MHNKCLLLGYNGTLKEEDIYFTSKSRILNNFLSRNNVYWTSFRICARRENVNNRSWDAIRPLESSRIYTECVNKIFKKVLARNAPEEL